MWQRHQPHQHAREGAAGQRAEERRSPVHRRLPLCGAEAELLVLDLNQEAADQPKGAARRAAHGQENATCHEPQPDDVRRTHGSSRDQLLHRGGGDERARSHRELGQSEASASLDDTHPQQQGAADKHPREQPVRIPIQLARESDAARRHGGLGQAAQAEREGEAVGVEAPQHDPLDLEPGHGRAKGDGGKRRPPKGRWEGEEGQQANKHRHVRCSGLRSRQRFAHGMHASASGENTTHPECKRINFVVAYFSLYSDFTHKLPSLIP